VEEIKKKIPKEHESDYKKSSKYLSKIRVRHGY
jgi:hypothetical protein